MGGMQQPMQGTPQTQNIQGQQPAFDPMTGQPLAPQGAPQVPVGAQFCPQTGQPLNPQPVAQFCPQTGQPLNQPVQAVAQFCPQTGQPLNQPVPAPAAAPADESPQAKLAVLQNLLDQGVISQEDFEAQKANL